MLVVLGGAGPVPGGWAAARTVPDTLLADAHPGGCSCCGGGRNGFARLLGTAFRDRATGILPFFTAVFVALPQELERMAAETVQKDLSTSSRYRLETPFKRKLISL